MRGGDTGAVAHASRAALPLKAGLRRQDAGLWLTLALCLVGLWPLLSSGELALGHDTLFHIYRSAEMSRTWSHGVLMPRWAESFYFGYGSPLFQYYASLSYYLAAVGNQLLGLDVPAALRLLVMVCLPAAGGGMYLFARERGGPVAGVIAGLCYVYSPYILYREPHVRGAYPELLAFAVFPWAMWRFERLLIAGRARDVAWAAVTAWLLVISHNLMAMVLAGVLAAWLAWNLLARVVDRRRFGLAVLAGALGVGLAAYFWLPVILERDAIQLSNVTGIPSLDYRNAFVRFGALFEFPSRTDAALTGGLLPHASLGVVQWALALAGALAAAAMVTRRVLRRRTLRAAFEVPEATRLAVLYAGMALAFVCLMLDVSEPLWDAVSVIAYLQFPWRLLGPAAFALAALAGTNAAWIARLPDRWGGAIIALIVVAVIAAATPLFYVDDRWRTGPVDASVAAYHAQEVDGSLPPGATVSNEFLPKHALVLPGVTARLLDDYADGYPVDKLNREAVPVGVEVTSLDHGPQHDAWRVQAAAPFTMEVFTLYFAGWRATVDGEPVDITPSEPHGLIRFDVPAGEHTVRLALARTPVRWAGVSISAAALVGLAVIAVVGWRRRGESDRAVTGRGGAMRPGWAVGLVAGGLAALLLAGWLMGEGRAWVRSAPGEARLADHQTGFRFGESLELVGYTLSADRASPGDRVWLTVYWYARAPVSIDYRSFVHVSAGGPPLAQADKILPADVPTSEWAAGSLVGDEYVIALPPDMPPGAYDVRIGLWTCEGLPEGDCGNGLRLPVTGEDGEPLGDAALLQQITVK